MTDRETKERIEELRKDRNLLEHHISNLKIWLNSHSPNDENWMTKYQESKNKKAHLLEVILELQPLNETINQIL